MKLKITLLLLTFLLGCSGLRPDEDEVVETLDSSASDLSAIEDDVQEPSLLQQEEEVREKKLSDILDMLEVATESETMGGKNVRNVSDNQLSQEYASMEHMGDDEYDHHDDENDDYDGDDTHNSTDGEEDHNNGTHPQEIQSTELATAAAAVKDSKIIDIDAEIKTEDSLESSSNKKSRIGRLLPPTTTMTTSIPDYVRKSKTLTDLNNSQEPLNLALSEEYVDGNQDIGKRKTDVPPPQPRVANQEDILPSGRKYYDVDDAIDGDNHQHHDDEDYNEHDGNGVNSHHKGPGSMPHHKALPTPAPQNSSEEYYDDEHMSSQEDYGQLSSTTVSPLAQTAEGINHPLSDESLMRALFPGFPLVFNPLNTSVPSSTPNVVVDTTTASTTTSSSIIIDSSTTLPSIDSLVTPMTTIQTDAATATTTQIPAILTQLHHSHNSGGMTSTAAAVAPVTTGDKKGKHIPIIPTTTSATASATTLSNTGNTGSSSHSRRRLMPHEQLRNYIEDAYIRMPLAVIVDPSTDSLEKTKTLWNDALQSNLNIKIVMVTLNESDVPAAFYFNNTRQFLAGLNSIKEHEGGDAFRGISHAAELVPYDSAVFISTATLANHTDQVHDAAITLLKKRIRLYLIWFGERALSENETQETVGGILGEVAIRSGGEVLHIVGSENSQELEGSTLTIVADAFRGSQEVDVPVDTTLSSLHVKIDKLMRRAVLETPNGEINLKKLVKFKTRLMMTPADDKRLDAYVPLTKLRKATVFKLKMIPMDMDGEYKVFIRGERKADTFLDDMIKHFETYFYEGRTSYPARFRNGHLQSITSALAIATVPTHSQLRFPDENNGPKDEVETFSSQEIHNDIDNKEETTTSPIQNLTTSMAANTMLSQRSINALQRTNTKIEMGIHSQVLVAPGMLGQLYFEVTNTGCTSMFYNIQVVDEKRFLLKLIPQSIFLGAGQMATITVTVLVTQNTPSGTIDHITFSTTGGGSTSSLSVNLKVFTSVDAQDNTPPSITWAHGSRCDSITPESSSCGERFWSMFITAQDWQTGLMRLQATPNAGLVYTNDYTVGSTEPLKATYIATCCDPKLNLVAYDLAGNQQSYNIDARDLVLNEASIAAITLGALLLLLIIVIIIVAIVWCCRRRKVVLDMPTYRSHSTRSME